MTLPSTTLPSRSTAASAPSLSAPFPSPNDILSSAKNALTALIESGVPSTDSRVETLISLIRRYKSAHPTILPLSSPPLRKPLAHSVQSNSAPITIANHYNGVPPVLLPIAAQHPTSQKRSFLQHNQASIASARLAFEETVITTNVAAESFPLAHIFVPLHASSHGLPPGATHDPEGSSNQGIPRISPDTSTNAPPSAFRTSCTFSQDVRRSLTSKRKDVRSLTRPPLSRAVTSPRRRQASAGSSPSAPCLPFESQHCGNVSAEHAFQIKAQAEAFRRLLRGLDIPLESRLAAQGISSSVFSPLPAPVLHRGSSDPEINSLHSTDPSLLSITPEPFDPRRLPRFPLCHTFTERDVVMPGEQNVSLEDLNIRLLVAETHHKRLHARYFLETSAFPQHKLTSHVHSCLNSKTRQQRAQLIDELCVRSQTSGSALMSIQPPSHKESPLTSVHHHEQLSRKLEHSVLLDCAAVPIAVASTPTNTPSINALRKDREKRVAVRVQTRIQEISELLPTATDSLRRALLIEQKQLRLLPLQAKIRKRVMTSMHRTMHRSGLSDLTSGKIMKMRRKLVLGPSSRTSTALSASGSSRAEQAYRAQQETRRRARHSNMLQALTNHGSQFKTFVQQRSALKKRLMKDLERYFRDRSREEERRRKKEQMDRLRALRNNNEDEYLELLKTTKNQRLIQLLRQTDEYLMQIGAQVERQKRTVREEDDSASGENGGIARDEETKANGDEDHSQSDEDELNQLRKRRNDYYTITHTISEKVHQPKCLVGGNLKPYQLEGLEWLVSLYNNNLNGILADEMGLGKTIQTLSLITYLIEVKNVFGPFLVIVPLSVISNWVREIGNWAPSLVTVVYKGDPATRKSIQLFKMQGGSYNVLLTTYEFIVKDKNVLGRIRWKYIIMDEGHRMKNADCKLALTLGAKYTSRNRLLLTGTPLQNNMTELWALLNFLLPTIFSSAETFETWFNAPFQASVLGESAELNEEENLLIISRLHQVLRPFMLRRLKTDVEAQLPEKVEIVFRCNMSIWQRVLYRQMRNKLGIAGGAGNVGIRSFNNIMMQLKKVCNHPFLFYHEEELMSLPHEHLIRAAGKFELLDHVLRKLKHTGHRVLIFSQMTAALNYLEYFLASIGMKHLRLDGMTKADDRQEMLELFNAKDSEYFCFLLSTRAGGLGLNLQTADTVIIFDSDWNPMMDLQAQDRAHRIGQTKEVRVFRLICSGSVEVKILERATRKLQIESQVIQAGQFNNKSSDKDRHELLKDLLRQQTDDDFARKDVTSLEEINRKLARSDEEFEIFEAIDNELQEKSGGQPRLLESEEELPAWVLKPEQEVKQKEQSEADYMLEHGRGRRKRKQVVYDDNLTEREWTIAMEEEGDIVEAVKRKKRRTMAANGNLSEASKDDASSVLKSESEDKVPSKEDIYSYNVEDDDGDVPLIVANGKRSSKKLEPFVDPELNPAPRVPRKRGRPRKSSAQNGR